MPNSNVDVANQQSPAITLETLQTLLANVASKDVSAIIWSFLKLIRVVCHLLKGTKFMRTRLSSYNYFKFLGTHRLVICDFVPEILGMQKLKKQFQALYRTIGGTLLLFYSTCLLSTMKAPYMIYSDYKHR